MMMYLTRLDPRYQSKPHVLNILMCTFTLFLEPTAENRDNLQYFLEAIHKPEIYCMTLFRKYEVTHVQILGKQNSHGVPQML